MSMKIKWSMIKVEGEPVEGQSDAGCTTYKYGGVPAKITISVTGGGKDVPVVMKTGTTVEVCSDVATVKGEMRTRPKGSGGKGGKR